MPLFTSKTVRASSVFNMTTQASHSYSVQTLNSAWVDSVLKYVLSILARRMQLANVAFHWLLGLLANVSASLSLKIEIWNAPVCPVLLYGCGT